MKQRDIDFMLTMSNIICKIENGEDCTAECREVKTMTEENKESIVSQLMDRLARGEDKVAENIVQAIREIGYLDNEYLEDFSQSMQLKNSTPQEKQEMVRKVISKKQAYKKVMMEDIFWKNLTMIAVNCKDNSLLTQFIKTIEQLKVEE